MAVRMRRHWPNTIILCLTIVIIVASTHFRLASTCLMPPPKSAMDWACEGSDPQNAHCVFGYLAQKRPVTKDIKAPEGKPFELHCEPLVRVKPLLYERDWPQHGAGGRLRMSAGGYFWTLNGTVVYCGRARCSIHRLTFASIRRADAGTYTCAYLHPCEYELSRAERYSFCPLEYGIAVRLTVDPASKAVNNTEQPTFARVTAPWKSSGSCAVTSAFPWTTMISTLLWSTNFHLKKISSWRTF
ncbi:uncharacterized protein LOC129593416 [Paramacrobiotus metropolitanus]|uniref:uncharacterized protein LOC129593416 n=1 Tax=Paramacrobiotus metropolitanus TaxID=2943436 RepID=UPI002445B993|nr:uncharacterized protein LOC129593416 [Paramacrobiotus metropolitanus]